MFMCACELFVLYVSTLHCKNFNTVFYFLPSCRCFLSRGHVFTAMRGGVRGGGGREKKCVTAFLLV